MVPLRQPDRGGAAAEAKRAPNAHIEQGDDAVAANTRFLNPDTLYKPPGYSHVVEVTGPGRTVYIAGQLGLDKDGNLVGAPGDFKAQAVQTFENLKLALAAVGADFSHVVKVTNLLADTKYLPIFRDVRNQYLKTATPPASTTVAISQFARDGALLEVEAVAVIPA
jgi:enamine deaminase RidA (YjgF/YER057c/UK114 family)